MSDVESFRVLYVDDDADFLTVAAERLQRTDDKLVVETTTSPAHAIEVLSGRDVDCVLSDYDMPSMDGLGFLGRVRDAGFEQPFILYTGKGSEEVASEAISAGVTDYLQKSTGSEQYELLANRIRNAVTQYRDATRAAELERIRSVIKDVNQVLLRAGTREDLEADVCRVISEARPYAFAWIGTADPETGTVTPRATGGEGPEDPAGIAVATDEGTAAGSPAERAIETGEITVSQSPQVVSTAGPRAVEGTDPDYDFRACAAIPLRFDASLYGVLQVYSSETDAFDDRQRELLWELGEDVAHTLHRLDRERELRRFEKAAEHAGHAVFITDRDGTIQYVNPAFERITGYPAKEAVGKKPSIISSGKMDETYYEALWETILAGEVWEEEIVNRRRSGELYHTHQTIAPITSESGDVSAFVAVQIDVTERREREETLELQNERLDAYANLISHDLRNPLSIARGHLELAREERSGDDHLEVVDRTLARMDQLVSDLLRLARAEEKLEEAESVDLGSVFRETWESIDTDGATLEVGTDTTVLADENLLRQVAENLLTNAVEHGSSRSRPSSTHGDAVEGRSADVTVTVGDLERGFYVADDGPGIPEDAREEVLTPGYSTSDEGTGFGLNVVTQIANAHGWSIEVTESDMGGARFEITGVGGETL